MLVLRTTDERERERNHNCLEDRMDIEKYTAGKARGLSSVTLQGDSTLLIKWPDGFDPATGEAKSPVERGYQPADIAAMKVAAQDAVTAAEDALSRAEAKVSMHDDLLADVAAAKAKKP